MEALNIFMLSKSLKGATLMRAKHFKFAVVISNPPYVLMKSTAKEKEFFSIHYKTTENHIQTATLFMELGYNLTQQAGILSFLVPAPMLNIKIHAKIRNLFLHSPGKLSLIKINDITFPGIAVDTCIFNFKKHATDKVTAYSLSNKKLCKISTIDKHFFTNTENQVFSFSMLKHPNILNTYEKIENTTQKLKNIANSKCGVTVYTVGKGTPKLSKQNKVNNIYQASYKVDNTYYPFLQGKNIQRYQTDWTHQYLKYGDNLAEKRSLDLFQGNRILTRRILTKDTYTLKTAYVKKTYINDRTLLIVTDIQINPLALLAVMNSKPLNIWFHLKFNKIQQKAFPQFQLHELNQFPIPILAKNVQTQLATLVTNIMHKRQTQTDYSKEDQTIDNIIMDCFNLSAIDKAAVDNFMLY